MPTSRKLVPYSDSSSSDDSSSESDEDENDHFKKHRLSLSKKKTILAGRKERRQKLKEKQKESRHMKQNGKRDELVSHYYHIKERMERKSRKFKTQSKVYDVSFNKYEQPFEYTHELFNSMVHEMKDRCNAKPRDKVRVSITHPKLNFGIHVPFDDASNVTGETLLNEIERVVQSNEKFKIHDGEMQAEFTHISMPEGSGKARRNMHYGSHVSIENMMRLKRSVIQIDNADDSMCLARSIVVGMCYAQKSESKEWRKRWNVIRKSKYNLQKREAETLLDSAGIKHDQACGLEEYKKIQAILYPEYIIKIHAQHAKSDLLFTAPEITKQSKVVHVYFHNGHFDTIISIKGFLGYSYYCNYCDIGYKCKEQHKCKHICDCYSTTICEKGFRVQCKDCLRWFRSAECFQKHKTLSGKSEKSICKSVWVCKTCGQMVVGTRKNHLCAGVKKCKYCKKIVESSHDCYIPKYVSPEKEDTPDVPFIFYDFECRFDSGEHIPNFCVAQRACSNCIRKPLSETCLRCDTVAGNREVIFRGDQTLPDFCSWLFNPIHKGATVIAHNAQGYDAQFILRYLVTHGTVKPKLIMNGGKIIMMEAHGVRLIDSMSFISMPLSLFPKTFGLTEMAKGWFPFWANTHEFQEYIGPYLPLDYYKPGCMKPESRVQFLKWYNEKIENHEIFNFKKEMEKYCKSDVDILRRGCGEFQHQLMTSDNIDPFLEASTLAQACNKAWRKNSMPENSFGIISDAGYPHKTRYSIKGIRWIQGIAYTDGTKIRHALNGGEQQIGSYFVDGFDEETKTVYEFLGCWTHGCKECYPKRETKNPYSLQTMETLYRHTFERFDILQGQGYTIKYIWECQFDQSYANDTVYKSLIDRFYPHLEPIEPREALFGGRTNAVQLYHEVDETTNQEIKYADICSLYPYVCKYKAYPLGHPVILSQEQIQSNDIQQYKGLIKCKVLPPQNVWMPVLPLHCNKKMVFTLCRTCAEKECTFCDHNDADRALIGTWTSVELHKALEKGYQVLDIYHIWHWDHWSSQVYSKYINKYLKMKQEASGYPTWVKSEEDQVQFKQEYLKAEGIHLDQIESNPGKRAFAKTMLNCLWGKNAQNNILPKTEYVNKLSRYYDIVSDTNIKLNYVAVFDHDAFALMNFSDKSDQVEPHSSANVVVASFVTAYARLELYSVLERLEQRVLYFDTDSCMYIYDPEQYNIPIINSRLGKWTDEMPEGKIVKYVALGPKNYGYEYIAGGERHTTCKVKGITLDYNTTQKVNFSTMVECVKDREHFSRVIDYPSRIRRHRDRKVTSEPQTKTFRSVYTKRVVVDQYKTVPYGYLHS